MATQLRQAASLVTALLTLTASAACAQGTYPDRLVRIIVPSEPGGGSDTVARIVAQGMSKDLGRQVIVENRPGAGTMIGSDAVAKAAADGYTLLLGISPLAINPALHKKMPYDVLRDFAPITQLVLLPNLMVVHPSVPATSVKQFIALAKAHPADMLFASAGYGTLPHLSVELFASMAHIRMTHITYKSTGPGIIDLIGGRVAVMAPNMIAAIQHVRTGKLRALGVTTAARVASEREIPTIAEGGLPGYESVQWYGLLAPAGTPQDIIAMLHTKASAVLADPKSKELLARDGAETVASSPQEFAAYVKAETLKWARVVKDAGIQPE